MGRSTLLFSIALILFSMKGSYAQSDLTFIVDTSSGITSEQFNTLIDFVYDVTNQISIGRDSNRVALVTFDDTQHTYFALDEYTQKSEVLNAINRLKNSTMGGSRKTHEALTYVNNNIYSTPNQGTILLLTHGVGTSPNDMLFAVFSLNNIQLRYVIGVGAFIEDSTKIIELETAASDPDSDHLYLLRTFSELCNNVNEISVKLDTNATGNHICLPTTSTNQTETTSIDTPNVPTATTPTTEMTSSSQITTTSQSTNISSNSETTENVPSTVVTADIQSTTDTESSQSVVTESVQSTVVSNSVQSTVSTESSSQWPIDTESVQSTVVSNAVQSTATTESSSQSTLVTENGLSTTGSIDDESSNESTLLIAMVTISVVFCTLLLSGLLIFKFRRQSKMKELITLVVHEYPDSKNGPGPSKQRYTDRRQQVYKNGHSNKFHSYLKLSMMTNGVKGVNGVNGINTVAR